MMIIAALVLFRMTIGFHLLSSLYIHRPGKTASAVAKLCCLQCPWFLVLVFRQSMLLLGIGCLCEEAFRGTLCVFSYFMNGGLQQAITGGIPFTLSAQTLSARTYTPY